MRRVTKHVQSLSPSKVIINSLHAPVAERRQDLQQEQEEEAAARPLSATVRCGQQTGLHPLRWYQRSPDTGRPPQ